MKLLLKKCSMCASVIVHVFTSGDPNTELAVWGSCSEAGCRISGAHSSPSPHMALVEMWAGLCLAKKNESCVLARGRTVRSLRILSTSKNPVRKYGQRVKEK